MSASQRFTGANYYITWQPTSGPGNGNLYILSNDWTKFEFDKSIKLEDRTAAADTDASYNPTYKEGSVDLTLFGTAENFATSGADAATIEGTSGILSWYAKGSPATGKPKRAGPFIVEDKKEKAGFDKNVEYDIKFRKNGAMTYDDGSLQ